jgi:hypothetical protein
MTAGVGLRGSGLSGIPILGSDFRVRDWRACGVGDGAGYDRVCLLGE